MSQISRDENNKNLPRCIAENRAPTDAKSCASMSAKSCAKFVDSHKATECPVCHENGQLLRLYCGHHLCKDCWELMTKCENCMMVEACEMNHDGKSRCPICRET